eukprot:scpid46757/ scgid32416/ Adipocyte plasma membrane-associated protein
MERRTRTGAKPASLEEAGSLSGDSSKAHSNRRGGADSGRSRSKLGTCCDILGLLFLGGVSYLVYLALFADCIIDPQPRGVPPPPEMTGALSPDSSESLADAEILFPDVLVGAECLAWDDDGMLYTGTMSGQIWKVDPAADEPVLVANTGKVACDSSVRELRPECGRPLGLRVMPDNSLLIVDAFMGLLKLSLLDGKMETLVHQNQVVDGAPLVFADDLAIGPDGAVYFSDVSTYSMDKLFYDVMSAGGRGRIIRYDPVTGSASTFARDLHFANGVELSHDGKSIIVTETSMYRITRIFITGERTGQSEVLAENLPGFPDNVRRHPDSGYLVAMSAGRTWKSTLLDNRPYLVRLMINAVPYDELVKASNPYGLCVHVSESGDVIRTWHDARAHTLAFTSHCSMHGDHMFVGSFVSRGIGKLKLSKSLPQNAGN